MEPPIRPPPRALDSLIHPSFPLASPQSPHLPPATSSGAERRDPAPWNDPPFESNRTPSFHQRRRLPVPLPIQRQREAEEFNSRAHADHLRSRTSSSWSTYETGSYDEVRGQRELGRSRRELHDFLTRRTRIEVARRLSEEAHVPGSSTPSTTTTIPPPDIPSWTPGLGIIDYEHPIFEGPGSRFGGLERAEASGSSMSPTGPSSTQSAPTAIPNSEQPTPTSGLPRGMLRGSRLHPNRDLNPINTSILGPGLRRRTPPTSRSPTRGNTPGNVGPSTAETSGPVNSANTRSATRVTRRAGRHRYISDYSGYHGPPFDIFDAPGSRRHANRLRNMGDYIVSSLSSLLLLSSTAITHPFIVQRDEDFDDSFENLTNLTAALGEVKPRNTPSHVIASLPSGKYCEWATPSCDQRCPVCLDDVSVYACSYDTFAYSAGFLVSG